MSTPATASDVRTDVDMVRRSCRTMPLIRQSGTTASRLMASGRAVDLRAVARSMRAAVTGMPARVDRPETVGTRRAAEAVGA